MKRVIFVFLLICSFNSKAQFSYDFDKKIFEGKSVFKMDFTTNGGVVVLSDKSIYQYKASIDSFINVTTAFSGKNLSSITAVKSIDEDLFFVGTSNAFLYKYYQGVVTVINQTKGLTSSNITSFMENKRSNTNSLLIGTSVGIFETVDYNQFNKASGPSSAVRFWSPAPEIVSYDQIYNVSCTDISGKSLVNIHGSSTLYSSYNLIDSLKGLETINDGLKLTSGGTSNQYYSSFYYGSNYGLRSMSLNSCSDYTIKTWYDKASVNDIHLFPDAYFYENALVMLIASDSGLVYLDSAEYFYSPISVKKIEELQNIKVDLVSASLCSKKMFAATANGLWVFSIKNDIKIPEPNFVDVSDPFCSGDSVYIAGASYTGLSYQWMRNDTILIGENKSYMYASKPGVYKQIYFNCLSSDTIIVADLYYYDNIEIHIISGDEREVCSGSWVHIGSVKNLETKEPDYNLEYQWFKDGDSLLNQNYVYMWAYETGNYSFAAKNCNGFIVYSDTVSVIVRAPVTIPALTSTSFKNKYCVGDTLFLENSNGFRIDWGYEDSEGSFSDTSYYVIDDYIDGVSYKDDLGCKARLDFNFDYYDFVKPTEILNRQDSLFFCEGSYISVGYRFVRESPYIEALWSDGETGTHRNFSVPGIYIGDFYNISANCKHTFDTLLVIEKPGPDYTLPNDTTIYLGDTLKIYAPLEYKYYWFNESEWTYEDSTTTVRIITSDIETTYYINILVENFNDCLLEDYVLVNFIKSPLSAGDPIDYQKAITVYPNPFDSEIRIEQISSDKIKSVSLTSIEGREVFYYSLDSSEFGINLSTQNLPAGIYLLSVQMESGLFQHRKLKKSNY